MSRSISIKVAVAVIINSERHVLIVKRPAHVPQPGVWEFPGGKLEENEQGDDALKREIAEEVGLTVSSARFLTTVKSESENKQIDLLIYLVTEFSGYAQCLENQPELKWVTIPELAKFEFPKANVQIIALVKELCPIA
jgi:8-oxo-dGTP diphosphatase